MSPANLQTFIDTLKRVLEDRVQYCTEHIPNVFRDDITHSVRLAMTAILQLASYGKF